MTVRLEHANLAVRDIDGMIRFLQTAFPVFRIRHDEILDGKRWVHVGDDATYIALNMSTHEPARRWQPYAGLPGINHLGYEVDDVDALRKRMADAGYTDSTYPNDHPHRRRAYFYDPEGNDWEFVQYFSENAELRNDYALADE